jgi:hypothetical protein
VGKWKELNVVKTIRRKAARIAEDFD